MSAPASGEPLPTDSRSIAVRRLSGALGQWRTETRVTEELLSRQIHPDMDSGQLDMLAWIVNKAPVSVPGLADAMLLPVVAVEANVAELARMDLVRVSEPDDAGLCHVTPRPFAIKLAHSMNGTRLSTLNAAVALWRDSDVEHLADLLERLIEGLDHLDGTDLERLLLSRTADPGPA